MPTCWHCKRESDADHYDRTVHNRTALHGPWTGWRMAGRELVSPDGDRIAPERLRGLMFRAELEARRDRARARTAKAGLQGVVTVLRITSAELRDRYSGQAAG